MIEIDFNKYEKKQINVEWEFKYNCFIFKYKNFMFTLDRSTRVLIVGEYNGNTQELKDKDLKYKYLKCIILNKESNDSDKFKDADKQVISYLKEKLGEF